MTAPFTVRPVREATTGDIETSASILAEAFADDPVMSWALGGPGKALPLFRALARQVYLKRGFGHLIENAAATLWLPATAAATLAFAEEIQIVGAILRNAGPAALLRVKRLGDITARYHPKTPHYYLFAVGVRPAHAGKGQGGRLIREGLNRADADGADAYLENSNPKNTPLYQRLGFAPVAALPLPHSAPPLLGMLRPAQPRPA